MECESVTREPRDAPQFYLTAPSPCPYLPGMEERKVFTHLVGRRAAALNDTLTQTGFRRSQTIAYRPACENAAPAFRCGCWSSDFRPSANMRRIARHNDDLDRRDRRRPSRPPSNIRCFAPISTRATPTAAWPTCRCSTIR